MGPTDKDAKLSLQKRAPYLKTCLPASRSQKWSYIILGYYLATILIRPSTTAVTASNKTMHDPGNIHYLPVHSSNQDQDADLSQGPNYLPIGHTTATSEDEDGAHSEGDHGTHGSEGSEHGGGVHDEAHHGIHVSTVDFAHVSTPFIIAAWILCACFAKVGFHVTPKLEHIFPESCLLIVIGVIIGLILFYSDSLSPTLTPTTFFLYMLPPIILDAGYFMPNRLFFSNLGTILLFAVIATIWNTFTIGLSLWGLGTSGVYGVELPLLQTLLFSSLISAVDPVAVLAVFEEIHVNEVLYIVVFGESLLNDAVTVVLYHIFEGFSAMGAEQVTVGEVFKGVASFPVVALGGTLIGIIWGFVIGFTTRFTNHVRVIEPLFVFVMAYLSYLCAEIFHMSGILAITFCGITMKNYVEANISQKSHTTVKYTMKMVSSSAETIIFVFLGVATIQDAHYWSWWFVIATIVFCSVYRIIGVLIFTYLANHYRIHQLGFVDQFVMSYGGLRGAVAFALVLLIEPETVQGNEDVRHMFITTTITVVFFTVFIQGMTIKPLVEWLKVKRSDNRKETICERIHEKTMDHIMAGIETLLGQFGHYNIREKFKQWDNQYIKPYLIREIKGDEPKILETYARLILEDALLRNVNGADIVHGGDGGIGGAAAARKSIAASLVAANGKKASLNDTVGLAGLTPETLAVLIKNVLVDAMADVNISSLVERRLSNSSRRNSVSTSHKNSATLTDDGIQNLLGQEFARPSLKDRRLSYSRHSVNEDAVLASGASTLAMVNHRIPVHYKKIIKPAHQHGHGHHHNRKQHEHDRDRAYKSMYTNPTFNFEDDSDIGTAGIEEKKRQFSKSLNETSVGKKNIAPPIYTVSADYGSPDGDLPWKGQGQSTGTTDRNGNGCTDETDGLRQKEFPSWIKNKDYLMHTSPTSTYLDGITGSGPTTQHPSVKGVFQGQPESGTHIADNWIASPAPPPPTATRRGSTTGTVVPSMIKEAIEENSGTDSQSGKDGKNGSNKVSTRL